MSYLAFVAPALVCTATVTVATSEFTYPIMLGFKWNPFFIGMNSAPLTARQIMDGEVIFVTLRMILTGVFYFLVMLLFGAVPSDWGAGSVLAAVLAGLAFGTPLLAYSSSVQRGPRPVRDHHARRAAAAHAVQRHDLPADAAADLPAVDRLDLAALARHDAGAAVLLRGDRADLADRHPRGCTWWCSPSVGWQVAVRIATRRLDK